MLSPPTQMLGHLTSGVFNQTRQVDMQTTDENPLDLLEIGYEHE